MAVFPDRIVLKNSVDDQAAIEAAIGPGGESAITQGELVLGLSPSSLSIYSLDGSGNVISFNPESSTARAIVSETEPTSSPTGAIQEGDLWYRPSTASLFVYDSGAWFEVTNQSGSTGVARIIAGENLTISPSGGSGVVTINAEATGVEEANLDGNIYGRKDGSWVILEDAETLGGLSDVQLGVGQFPLDTGDTLFWDAAAQSWVNAPIGEFLQLTNLSDVDIPIDNIPDRSTLSYSEEQGTWVLGPPVLDVDAVATTWVITANGTSEYLFAGPGLTGIVPNPELSLVPGQAYVFVNSSGAHPFRIQSTPGLGGVPYSLGTTNNGTIGTVTFVVPFDAPDTLYYQCTSHASMGGVLNILNGSGGSGGGGGATSIDDLTDVDTTTSPPELGQALLWNNLTNNWVPGPRGVTQIIAGAGVQLSPQEGVGVVTISATGGGGDPDPSPASGGSGAGIYLQETQSSSSGSADFVGLGYSGILQKVASSSDAWICLYTSVAARVADAGRAFDTDPALGSGVLFEAYATAGEVIVVTPGTTYLNNEETLTEAIYAAVRSPLGTPVDASVTISAYGLAAITAVNGGTFGSGL